MGRRRRSSIIKDKKFFRNSVYESPTVMEGYLEKKSQGYLTQYNRRYFKLAGHYLKYYNDSGQGDDEIKGVIDLYDLDSCFQTGPKQDKIILKLRGISLNFRAEHKANAKEWIHK